MKLRFSSGSASVAAPPHAAHAARSGRTRWVVASVALAALLFLGASFAPGVGALSAPPGDKPRLVPPSNLRLRSAPDDAPAPAQARTLRPPKSPRLSAIKAPKLAPPAVPKVPDVAVAAKAPVAAVKAPAPPVAAVKAPAPPVAAVKAPAPPVAAVKAPAPPAAAAEAPAPPAVAAKAPLPPVAAIKAPLPPTAAAKAPAPPAAAALATNVSASTTAVAATTAAVDAAPAVALPSLPRPYHGPSGAPSGRLGSDASSRSAIKGLASALPSWTLTPRQACDVELLLNDGFSPLVGPMSQLTYERVLSHMRLGDGAQELRAARESLVLAPPTISTASATAGGNHSSSASLYGDALWPMPITLDIPQSLASGLHAGSRLALYDAYHTLVAVLTLGGDPWQADKLAEASAVFGTTDVSHPGVAHLLSGDSHAWYVGGALEGASLPTRLDFSALRLTPAGVRSAIAELGWTRTVAFQTRNPMHRAHIELTRLAAADVGPTGGVLIHPVVGLTKPGDFGYAVRVRCYLAVLAATAPPAPYYAPNGVLLALLPLAMRMGGPREALWHAIVRGNYGASDFIVGRDHAGVKDAAGRDFYGPYDAQALVQEHASELRMRVLAYAEVVHVPDVNSSSRGGGTFYPMDKLPAGAVTQSLSGTKFRAMLARGDPVPAWFSDPAVTAILSASSPPLHARGFTIFFTGLSGSGKTTILGALGERLRALVPGRTVTILDGDVVRTHLSRGLGFSIPDRTANVERIGFVASEAVRHGGIVLAAPIAPLYAARSAARSLIEGAGGGFLLVHVAPSLLECAERDTKGLYAGAGYARAAADPPPSTTKTVALPGVINNAQVRLSQSNSSPSTRAALDLGRITADLTGVSHSFEVPGAGGEVVDVTLDTGSGLSVEDAAAAIIAELVSQGYLQASGVGNGNTAAGSADDFSASEVALVAALQKMRDPKGSVAVAAAGSATTPLLSPTVIEWVSETTALARVFTHEATDTAAALCMPDWDAFSLPSADDASGAEISLRGGLPMRGSPTARHIIAATAQGRGIPAGAPAARVTLHIAPTAALASALLSSTTTALMTDDDRNIYVPLSDARVEEAEAAGVIESSAGVGASGSKAPKVLAAAAAVVADIAAGTLASLTANAGSTTSDPWLSTPVEAGTAVFKSQPPWESSAALPLHARQFAAYDLWTAARWAPYYNEASGAQQVLQPKAALAATTLVKGGRADAAVAVVAAEEEEEEEAGRAEAIKTVFLSHSRLITLLDHMLRLDPCATAVIALPALAPPTAEKGGDGARKGGKETEAAGDVDVNVEASTAELLSQKLMEEVGVDEGAPGRISSYATAFTRAALAAAAAFPHRVVITYL